MDIQKLPFRATGKFSELVLDYIERKEVLKDFISDFPDPENFASQLKRKSEHKIDRGLLSSELKKQYKTLSHSDAVMNNIGLLKNKNCFTVTTGHQLCLFTGPLYFIYKIVSVIRLSRELKIMHPENEFVPVFWMAGEDHDFAEINHAHVFGKTLQWDQEQTGAVGAISTGSMADVLDELYAILGESDHAEALKNLFDKAYKDQQTLAEATAVLVHELFAAEGLVILNADAAALKAVMLPIFKKEILQENSLKHIEKTSKALAASYKVQVYPRAINLFYMRDGLRSRIVKNDAYYEVLDTEIRFTEEEIVNELDLHPERFSPNVALRPLYQECLLPNLAYIGGGGELAYWFQLKANFDEWNVPFPLLLLRNSVLWIDKSSAAKMNQIQMASEALFVETDALISEYIKAQSGGEENLDTYKLPLENLFAEIAEKAVQFDPNLEKAVMAEKQKAFKSLQQIEGKMLRAAKRSEETAVNRIKSLKDKFAPNNGLQERYDNFIPLYLKHGKVLINILLENLNPLDERFVIVKEI